MGRRIITVSLILLAISIAIIIPILLVEANLFNMPELADLTPTPLPTLIPPTPTIPPKPIITVQGTPPSVSATSTYLVDMDTGNVLADINGEKPLPMASTTKIMTALIAIQTGNLNEPITVKQDAIDRILAGGSGAGLVLGDTLTLKDLLYGLLLPSGDDAAFTIADALGGTSNNFVQRMNLFAYHLHLFQTHYSNPDGLTLDNNNEHYTTTADLVRLARYAMTIPLFAQIVQTQNYTVPSTTQHHGYTWNNTNKLLVSYMGMIGIKTGFTYAAGYCLVFAATRDNYHIIGAVLHSTTEDQRAIDVKALLDWGFALPRRPPHS